MNHDLLRTRAVLSTLVLLAVTACAGTSTPAKAPQLSNTDASTLELASAERGEGVYGVRCAACHGQDLSGGGHIPPLAGRRFGEDWDGRSLRDLYSRTISTMPWTQPGSLSEAETVDIILYIAKKNGQTVEYPVRDPDDLNKIPIHVRN